MASTLCDELLGKETSIAPECATSIDSQIIECEEEGGASIIVISI